MTAAKVNLKRLPTKFDSGGFRFQQMRRHGKVALFSKTKLGHSHPTYEVVIIQTHPAERIFGRDLPQREVMPPSETWGTLGWSDSDLGSALNRFNRLVESRSKVRLQASGVAASASQPPGVADTAGSQIQLFL